MPPVAVVVEVDMFEAAPMFEEEAVIVVVPADIAAVLLPFAEVAVAVVAAVADVASVVVNIAALMVRVENGPSRAWVEI